MVTWRKLIVFVLPETDCRIALRVRLIDLSLYIETIFANSNHVGASAILERSVFRYSQK